MLEQTFFIIKPDALERGLVGEILSRIENKGLKITKLELVNSKPPIKAVGIATINP